MSANVWDRAIREGRRIDHADCVSAGDFVFLSGPRTVIAFQAVHVTRQDDIILLSPNAVRSYQLGGASQLRFEFALRVNEGVQ
ncbi:hypothetical protein [Bifidobacterium scardovii]|uniref:NlpC/P60 domain-containing protein n=1 Tax=Bifidobacterium scardovii TaxID=158787 RepID=A0A087DGQ8_9BIFI|nr:hypothetical protein [Bifidobacterium scardovii]DAE55517.1 MAG TPA: hypothetical protein [Caudoviricetes sp.]KFI94708.1 hypothetical protein BSCA_0760 [Bifidobacterium scardovii]MDK6349844.1 hypothetical protein [Bifidobacterium scardovii]MDU8982548.1 hypothetical protein [Bifidobacterium scardovii]BAQ32068.1 hypothetical protein BBSC_1988 [Bifidobacterium scardovii JCM 12489 = DSM 13734]